MSDEREAAPAPNGIEQFGGQESVWMEIIQHMESIYGQLADSQAEIERHSRELGDAKELLDNIVSSMSDVLVAVDSSGTISLVNDAAGHLFGFTRDALIGHTLDRLLPGSAKQQWSWRSLSRRIRVQNGLREVETTWQDQRGNLIPVGVTVSALRNRWGELMGGVLVARDLREAKRRIAEARAATAAARAKAEELEEANARLKHLQAELIQAAKMSSLGRLAAGVAHELNNPLGGITLYSDLLLEDMPEGDSRRRTVEKIAEQTARCRRIVSALLDFARPADAAARPVDVNTVLRETMSVLEGQEMFHNVEVRRELADDLPPLPGDPDQLRQAFVNIVLNAVEAMDGKGTLSLTSAPAEEGMAVLVTISDTGCGIPQEDIEHLFEPFFTTKDDGTGLGLPITYGIVERHNGTIEVSSEPGQGTTFRLLLRSMKGTTVEKA